MTNGTTEYIHARVDLYFEPEHIACNYCPLLETYARNQCRRTGEYILDAKYGVGRWCPLKFETNEQGEIENESVC
jgi:hypothetical protein